MKNNGKSPTRAYQAWVSWPYFDNGYGEWYHGNEFPVGIPRYSARSARADLSEWERNHSKEIVKINREVATSGRVGSKDTRVILAVRQIWPIPQSGLPGSGMFVSSMPID